MRARFALPFALLLVACGGSTTTDTTDSGADGTSEAAAETSTDSANDTATDSPGDSGDGGCVCLAASLSWGSDGGEVAFVDRSTLSSCHDYARTRTNSGSTTPSLTCAQALRDCPGDAVDADMASTTSDVNGALADADVQAALAKAPVLYGSDPRPVDGAVFQVMVGGKKIEVGGACGGASGCTEVPAGVAHLRDVLQEIDKEKELSVCSGFKF